VQHRGGPVGFVRVYGEDVLAWADYSGNRQYISIGNVAANDKVAMIFIDYPGRQRLKLLGHLTSLEVSDHPDLVRIFEAGGYDAAIEHIMKVKIEAFDWNCPLHITPRLTAEAVEALLAPLRRQVEDLEARLAEALAARL
jgi:predicted pyridoxine 5'-phosphate oxidase superfamily flavin-nucleotide-binding protein